MTQGLEGLRGTQEGLRALSGTPQLTHTQNLSAAFPESSGGCLNEWLDHKQKRVSPDSNI
jgi:hypothetical protein